MKFSEKIIQARKAKALTQEDLADAVGVSRQAVSKWETEEAKPDLDKLVAICNVLDLSMDYLCLDKQPEVTVELPQTQKPKNTRYFIVGVCIGLVAAILVGLLSMGLREKTRNPMVPNQNESASTSASTTVPTTEHDYTDVLSKITVANAKHDNIGWHAYHISFVPNMQIPGMQVQIAARNNQTGKTEYLDTIQSGTNYLVEFTSPNYAFDYDFIAVCSIGDLTVQFPLFNMESDNGSDYQLKNLWEE